jgi:hypothetical protein
MQSVVRVFTDVIESQTFECDDTDFFLKMERERDEIRVYDNIYVQFTYILNCHIVKTIRKIMSETRKYTAMTLHPPEILIYY